VDAKSFRHHFPVALPFPQGIAPKILCPAWPLLQRLAE
jgi:hypothetical protein